MRDAARNQAQVSEASILRRELARLTDQVERLAGIVEGALAARTGDEDRLLSAKEAAELLHVCTKTLNTMVRREGLPARKLGGQYRYRRAEILAWLDRRAEEPGARAALHGRKLRLARGEG